VKEVFRILDKFKLLSTKSTGNSCLTHLYTGICREVMGQGRVRTRVEKSLNFFRVHESKQEYLRVGAQT